MLGVKYLDRTWFYVKPLSQGGLEYPKLVKKEASEVAFEGKEGVGWIERKEKTFQSKDHMGR